MTARCAGATNPVALGTGSVIPPRLTLTRIAREPGRKALGRLPCKVIRALVSFEIGFIDAATLVVAHGDA
jgi:hypothetical protein